MLIILLLPLLLPHFTVAAEVTLEQYLAIDSVRLGSHKIEIEPRKSTNGITTGVVMLYGHILPAPYQVERRGRQLLINGVQAIPSLIAERQEKNPQRPRASPEKQALAARMRALRQEAVRLFSESRIGAAGKIRALMEQNADILSNVEVAGSGGEVCFNVSGSLVRRCWGLRADEMENDDRIARNEANNLEEAKRAIESALYEGRFVSVDSKAQWLDREDMRPEVNSIMADHSLSREQKIERLKALAGYGIALDIVDNYGAEEWEVGARSVQNPELDVRGRAKSSADIPAIRDKVILEVSKLPDDLGAQTAFLQFFPSSALGVAVASYSAVEWAFVIADHGIPWEARAAIAHALAKSRALDAATVLARRVRDESEHASFRSYAGTWLAQLESPAGDELIVQIVGDTSVPASYRAAIMAELGVRGFRDVDWLENVAWGKVAVSTIAKGTDEGAGIMWNAIRALGAAKDPRATDALIRYQLKNPQNAIVTEALARRKDPASIPTLIKVMTFEGPQISLSRELAAEGLGAFRTEDAIAALRRVVKDARPHDSLLITRGVEALAKIGDRESLPIIRQSMQRLAASSSGPAFKEQRAAGYGPLIDISRAIKELER